MNDLSLSRIAFENITEKKPKTGMTEEQGVQHHRSPQCISSSSIIWHMFSKFLFNYLIILSSAAYILSLFVYMIKYKKRMFCYTIASLLVRCQFTKKSFVLDSVIVKRKAKIKFLKYFLNTTM